MTKTNITLITIIGAIIIIGLIAFGNLSGVKITKNNNESATQDVAKQDQAQSDSAPDMNDEQGEENSDETAQPESSLPTNHSIVYTNTGFSVSNISIKLGDSVTFTNDSSGSMWIASDPHPSHSDYPEFDQKKGVSKGGEYTFVFDKEGTWGYHNHVNSTRKGTITVTK